MERKVKALMFVSATTTLLLSVSAQSLAQASTPAKQLKAPASVVVFDDTPAAPDRDLELLRKDIRSQKKQIVAANMDLSDDQAVKFWPVYDRYASELASIYDTKLALLSEYQDNYNTMTGDQAEGYIRRRAALEQDAMQLRLKYVPEFRKVLTGRQTARFFQIEWRLDLMINMQLSQAPLIDP